MFLKILVKEWRENILVFSLAVILMFALVALSLSNLREMTLNFSAMFLLLFLPFAAILIGSGGFYSEFKDNAWIYIFSRPIKKEILWIFKYISLLSILLLIFLLFILVKQFLPGLNEILSDIDFPTEFRGILSFSVYFVIPLIVFTISFSISILYDKQFIIFFVSIIIGAGLGFIYRYYLEFVWNTYFYTGNFRSFGLLIVLSFILASILTFIKTDFSQMGKKIFFFSKLVVLFLVISLVLGTVGIAKGDLFTGGRIFSPYYSSKHLDDVFIHTYSGGAERVIRYDSESDKVEKVFAGSIYSGPKLSISKDKIALFNYTKKGRRGWQKELWIINTEGTEKKNLTENDTSDSPFRNLEKWGNCLLSPDGSKVIFLTGKKDRKSKKNKITVWRMNSDGTGINKKNLDFPLNYSNFQLVAWPAATNNLILTVEEKSPTFKKVADRLIVVDIEKEKYQILFDDVRSEFYRKIMEVSPTYNHLGLVWRDHTENKEKLVILSLKTLDSKVIFEAELMKLWAMKWSQDGEKMAFSRARETLVYTLADDKLKRVSKRDYGYEIGFDWLTDGKKLALIIPDYGELYLKVFGEDFKEEKKIKIPYPVEGSVYLWGLDNKVLMHFNRRSLFRLDLDTEKWKKVY
jgi:Tol biopolymer transport system component